MEEELSQYYDEELPDPELRNKGVLYEQFVYSLYRDKGMIPQGFLPPKAFPKPCQNPVQIDVPKNMRFFIVFS